MRKLFSFVAIVIVSGMMGCCHDTCDNCRDICSSCNGHQAVHLNPAPVQQMPAPAEKK